MNNIINSKLIIEFTPNTEPVPFVTNPLVSSWFHETLGSNNKYHGEKSNYSISTLQGGKMCKNGDKTYLNFENGGYIIFSTLNSDMYVELLDKLHRNKYLGYGMTYNGYSFKDFNLSPRFDKVKTNSELLLCTKDNNKKDIYLNVKDHPEFLEILIEKTKNKLKEYLSEDDFKGFNIELINPDKANRKWVALPTVVHCTSMVRMKIYGTKKLRTVLYLIGIGKSTGYGFGSLSILN